MESRHQLIQKLKTACMAENLIICLDYDGTLVEIVEEPSRAILPTATAQLLQQIDSLPKTSLTIISGRGLMDLRRVSNLAETIQLIGSHGLEWNEATLQHLGSDALPEPASTAATTNLELIANVLGPVDTPASGIELEHKPHSIAIHYRKADAQTRHNLLSHLKQSLESLKGVHLLHGHCVLEVSCHELNKGTCLRTLRTRTGANPTVVYIGDDESDERALATLHSTDVGIRVGHYPSVAQFHVSGPGEVIELLWMIHHFRNSKNQRVDCTTQLGP